MELEREREREREREIVCVLKMSRFFALLTKISKDNYIKLVFFDLKRAESIIFKNNFISEQITIKISL